jgi:hypothetical protein
LYSISIIKSGITQIPVPEQVTSGEHNVRFTVNYIPQGVTLTVVVRSNCSCEKEMTARFKQSLGGDGRRHEKKGKRKRMMKTIKEKEQKKKETITSSHTSH